MNEIIKITEQNGKRAVSARELHAFLESKQEFANWIKSRIEKYGLVENQDYEVFDSFIKNPSGGRPLIEYALTVDAAKELSMVEGNERGKQARHYFIECEKALQTGGFQVPSSFKEALLLAAKQQEQIEQLEAMRKQDAPKVLFAKAVETSQRSCLVSELAKILQQNGVSIGQNRLFQWLRNNGYLCSKGQYYNQPTQKAMELGLFEIKQTTINKPDGTILVSTTTKVSGKEQVYFVNKFLGKEVA